MVRAAIVLVVALVLTVGGAAIAAPPAAASVSIGVTPSLVELSAEPGDTGSQELTVSNEGDEPFDATTGIGVLRSADAEASAEEWLTVEPASFSLEPGQTQTVTVGMTIPDDLPSGGYYGLVTITTGATQVEGSGAGIAGQVGVPFLFAIEGDAELSQEAEIEQFAAVLETDGRIGFRATVRNAGNLYVVTKGTVQVDEADGEKLGSLDFPETTPILQGNTQLVQTQGTLPLEEGARYQASVALDYGADEPATAETDFTVDVPTLDISDLGVCENLDRGPTLRAALGNDGDLGVFPAVTLAVRDANGSELGSGPLPEAPLIWPQDETSFAVDFPQRLVTGSYVFAVTVELPNGEPITEELTFQIGGTGSDVAPICSDVATPTS